MAKPRLSFSDVAERARRTARGSLPPAGVDPDAAAGADVRLRRAIRQRLRRTRSLRRARVTELGLLVAEMEGRGRWNERLVEDRARELDRDDAELRGLAQALDGEVELSDLIARGVVAECPSCGRLGGPGDSFCAGCGAERSARDVATIPPSA